MTPKDAGESWVEEIRVLDAEIESLSEQKKQTEKQIRRLLLEEDPIQGKVYAQEIHGLQQERLRLQVEVDMRRKKKNRLLLAREEQDSFPFS